MTPEEIQKMLDKKFKDVQNDLADAQKNGATKEEIQNLHKEIEKNGTALESFIEGQKKQVVENVTKQFNGFVEENHDEIKSIFTKGSGEVQFVPKAVEDITTGSGSDVGTPSHLLHTDLGNVNLRNDNALLSLANVSSTGDARFSYSESVPKEGDYAFVAEGGLKPPLDWKWENRFPEPKKAAGHEVLTEEAVKDVNRLQQVAQKYLKDKHDLFKVKGAFFADGTGENPLGATEAARTFVAGDMADAFDNGTVKLMDIINAISTDIYTMENYEDEPNHMPNVALISPIDFFLQIVSAKDDRGLPMYPQASMFNSINLGGMTIRPWVKIPTGKIFVADMSKYNIVNYVPYSIRLGWVNDQFIRNKFTMVGESRYYQYIKNLDLTAFVYDDVTTVQAAIEADA